MRQWWWRAGEKSLNRRKVKGGHRWDCMAGAAFSKTKLGFWIRKPMALVMPGSLAHWGPWMSQVAMLRAQPCGVKWL